MNTPISGLAAGAPVTDPNLFANVQSIGTGPVKTTALEIKTYVANNLTLTGTPIFPQTLTIGTVTYTWPAANGAIGSVLTNNGTGTLTWQTPTGITSVGLDASPVGLTVSGSPVTSSGNLVITGGVLNVANGGTGASTPAAALINLLPATSPSTAAYVLANDGSGNFYWTAGGGGGGGGGGVATFSAGTTGLTPVGASTGNIVLGGTLAVANGGTGVTSLPALQALVLPAQGGNAGKVLGTNGTTASWVAVSGTGTVTSVSMDPSTTGLTVNGGTAPATITASGTFILGGTLAVANGGTGRTSLGTGVQTALGNGVNTNGGFLLAGAGGVLPIAQGGTNASTATAALTNLLPAQSGGTAGQVLTSNGSAATWQSLSGVSVTSVSGGTTGMSFGAGTGAVTMTGTLNAANGGTGINGSAAPKGALLIGNGTGYTLNTLTAGTGITIDNTVTGVITINSTGGGGGVTNVTSGIPSLSFTNPTTTPTLTGTLAYANGGTGLTAAPTNGQLLIGNGTGYTLAQLSAGTNISITNAAGSVTINGPSALVSSITFGSTGLTPSTATSGAISVGGVLNTTNGGTGLSSVGVNGSALVSNGTSLAYGNPLYATNLTGATANTVPYQSAANTTAYAGPGAAGSYLAGNGPGSAPTFKAATLTLGATPLNLNTTTTALTGMTGITMTGGYTPPGDDDVATKSYVDNVIQPINRIAPADVATTANLVSLSGFPTIDGYTVSATDRVLVKNQTSSQDDGIYDVDGAGVWTRSTDLNDPSEFTSASVFVLNGTTQANTSWIQTATVATVGTSPQVWQQQSGLYTYVAGTGISLSPATTINNTGVLSLSTGTTGLTVSSATGAVTLAGTLAIANGGTSATTAQGARTNLLPTQAGQTGKFLQSNGTDVVWAAAAGGAVYYLAVTSTGDIPTKISGAGYTDAAGNSYVLYNSTASNITLTATSIPNFASFTDCTATSLVLGAGKTMMISTTVAGSTYVIDASNYLSGGIFTAQPNASSTMVNIINGIPAIDNEGNLYAIENTSNAPIVVSGLTVDNPSAFPGYTQSNSFTIPAYGEALVLTTATSANYVVLSISNSVATNLSGGSQNRIVYQTAANQTNFLPTGTAGQVLKSNGSALAPSWAASTAAFYIDATTSTAEPISTVISTAGYTDAVGALYVIYNSSAATKLISTTSIDNAQSFPTFASSSTIALQPKQTATIVTDVVGTNYSIVNISNLAGAAAAAISASDTVSNLLTGAGITEYNGLLVTLTNTSGSTQTITAATFNGHQAFAPATSTGSIKLPATESVTLIVTTSGTTYQIVTMSSPSLTTISTAVDYTTSTAITNGFVNGDLLSITNTDTVSHTVTAASLVNSGSYPANATSTVFTVGAGATVTLALASASANNWQIISYSSNATTAVTSTGTGGTITAAITAGSIVQQIGMLITIHNSSAVSSIGLTGTLTNFQPWAPAASASGVTIQANECVTLRVVTPGSAYDVINLTNTNIAADVTADFNLSATINSGTVLGGLATFTNTNAVGNVVITADSFENGDTWPVPTRKVPTSGPYNKFYLPADGTVTFALTSTTANNWKIISYEYPAMQAGAVAFAIGNATGSPATLGPSKVIDATTLFPVVTYGTPDTASLINPQNYLDTATGIFQPLVAGYYQINAAITQSAANTTPLMGVGLIKNWDATTPDLVAFTVDYVASSGGVNQGSNISAVVYMNGTTDTLRVGLYITAGAWSANTNANAINFSGSLVTQQNIINTTSGIYNVPIDSADDNRTVPAILSSNGIGEVVNDLYVITNIDTVNVTITATSFIGYQAYPSQATSTSIVLTPGATLELQNVTIGSGYQIVILNTPINVGSVAFNATDTFTTVNQTEVTNYDTTNINPQNYFNPTTGRYTPKTAGYYQVTVSATGLAGGFMGAAIYKNGTNVSGWSYNDTGGGNFSSVTPSLVVYMNGTTDYLSAFVTGGGTSKNIAVNFSAFLTNQTLTEVVGTTASALVSLAATQAIPTSTITKISFDTVGADPQSWWNATNKRFIPTIPGYYQISGEMTYVTGNQTVYEIWVYKNGTGIYNSLENSINYVSIPMSTVVYMNGTTDYLEVYAFQPSGISINIGGNITRNMFAISLVGANQAVPAVTDTKFATARANGATGDYCVVQLDNIKTGFRNIGPAYVWLSTVSGTATIYGEITTAWYGGGGGAVGISNATNQNPRNLTTTPDLFISSGASGQINAIFTDDVSGRTYRATWIVGYGYVNMQVFLERISG